MKNGIPAQGIDRILDEVHLYHGPLLLGLDSLDNSSYVNEESIGPLILSEDLSTIQPVSVNSKRNPFQVEGAHCKAAFLKRGFAGRLIQKISEDQVIIGYLRPVSEHTGDRGFDANVLVRTRFPSILTRRSDIIADMRKLLLASSKIEEIKLWDMRRKSYRSSKSELFC